MKLHEKETDVLLSLLSYCLFQQKPEIDPVDVDWKKMISSANDHVVTPLLYPAVMQIPNVPVEIFDSVQRHAVRSSVKLERVAKIQSEVLGLLNNENIPCVVLKGMAVARNYPFPELRLSGDMDLLVSCSDMARANELLLSAGFVCADKNEIHVVYGKNGIIIELHHHISRFPDSDKGNFAKEFMSDAVNHSRTEAVGIYEFPALEQPYQLLALLMHMERHMGASGIGLRQLCDWAVSVYHMKQDEECEFLKLAADCGLLDFSRIITKVCQKYLRLPKLHWTQGVEDEIVTAVMEDILSVGDFQIQQLKRPYGSVVIDPYGSGDAENGNIIVTYIKRVKRKMSVDYSWAKSNFLVPFFCVFYLLKWLFEILTGKSVHRNFGNTLITARKRERMLRKLRLYR